MNFPIPGTQARAALGLHIPGTLKTRRSPWSQMGLEIISFDFFGLLSDILIHFLFKKHYKQENFCPKTEK